MISPAAFKLHSLGTAVSVVHGRPGFVPDEYLAGLTGADLEDPGADPVFLAAELCAAGIWEPVAGGWRVLDAYAVQVCADRLRELREADARRAGGTAPGPPGHAQGGPVAAGATRTTRFGNRNRAGTAASFRCGWCGGLAGAIILARAGTRTDIGNASGRRLTADGLILEGFLGRSWHPQAAGIVDAVQALIERGNVDPAAIGAISGTLCDMTPFYCPECELNYCDRDWDTTVDFNAELYDWIMGTCPNGHRHIVG